MNEAERLLSERPRFRGSTAFGIFAQIVHLPATNRFYPPHGPASARRAVELHVADHGLDRRAAAQFAPDGCGDPALPAGDEDLGRVLDLVAAIAAIDPWVRLCRPESARWVENPYWQYLCGSTTCS